MAYGRDAFSLHFDDDWNMRVETHRGGGGEVAGVSEKEYPEKMPGEGRLTRLAQIGLARVEGSCYETVYFMGRYYYFPC